MRNDCKQAMCSQALKLAWRIGLPHWETEEAFERLLALLCVRRRIVNEVALFDSITHHLYIPLEDYARRMELAAERLDALRRAGVGSAGINVLATIAHMDEGWSYMPPLPFQPMVGHDGSVSTGCACPNTPQMREYVRAKYALVAHARPDFIWVDDDIRMHHHGVAWACFCPTCLDLFCRKAGRKYSREKLVRALDEPEQGRLRELWVQQNIESIESLLEEIKRVLREVGPTIATDLMTCGPAWTTYSGMAFGRWFVALDAVKSRPGGGGFYTDRTPIEMYYKGVDSGRQRALLPTTVTDLQYELENFPYQLLKKSKTALVDECALALAYGMNGVAFNLFALPAAEADFLPYMDWIEALRPLWAALVAHTGGLPTAGLWPAWSAELAAKRSVRQGEGSWFGRNAKYDITRPLVLGEIGLPIAVDRPGCATVLCGRVAEVFDDAELRVMLSGGVLMDSTALDVLTERGLGHLSGVRVAQRLDNGVMERFTEDPINGFAAGRVRDARIEFWGDPRGMGDVLEPVAEGVRVLAHMEDYFYRNRGPCMTAFENELGGRVVVMGYAPWIFLHSVAKRVQIQNVADWVSRGCVPVRIDEAVTLIPVARVSVDRRRAVVVLLNAGMDEIEKVSVHVRCEAKRVRVLAPDMPVRTLSMRPEVGGGRVTLRNISPWGVRVVLVGESETERGDAMH